MTAPGRVVIGEDDVLLREGIARVLADAGYDVVAQAGDAEAFLRKALAHQADIAVVDVKMPPDHTDDGLRAAVELRRQRPAMGVLILSQYCEERYAVELIGDRAEGVGLPPEGARRRRRGVRRRGRSCRSGGTALDSEVVAHMLGRRSYQSPLEELTPREREVLAAMAEGKSNIGIAEELFVTEAAVEKHVTNIFLKLGLAPPHTGHRRVLAVLTYMRESST